MSNRLINTLGILLVIAIIIGFMWLLSFGYQYYKVFSATQSGKAELAQADQNRKIKITEAEANNAAATSNAEAQIKIARAQATAEIERAKGVAEANKIIGDSLKGNEDYLRYLYITGLTDKAAQVVYIPTEGALPILEAGKR